MISENDTNKKAKARSKSFLGNFPERALHRLGATLGGVWISSLIINLLWPLPDQISTSRTSINQQLKSAQVPKTPVSILVAHEQKSTLGLVLIKVYPNEPIQVLQLPVNIDHQPILQKTNKSSQRSQA